MKITGIVLSLWAICLSCNQKAKEDLSTFKKAYSERSIKSASNRLEECSSTYCVAYGNSALAHIYDRLEQYDSALFYAKEAVKLYDQIDEKDEIINMYWFSGDVLSNSGKQSMALSVYNKALSLNPSKKVSMGIKLDMGRSHYIKGDHREARELLNSAIEYFEGKDQIEFADAHLLKGNLELVYQRNIGGQDYNDSFYHYFTALKNFNEDYQKAEVLSNIGKLYIHESKYEEAKKFLDSAQNMRPNDQYIQNLVTYNLGIFYQENEQLSKSINYFMKVIDFNKGLSDEVNYCYGELIIAKMKSGEINEAERLVREFTKKADIELEKAEELKKITNDLLADKNAEIAEIKEDKKIQVFIFSTITNISLIGGLVILMLLARSRYKLRKQRKEKIKWFEDEIGLD